eukprot:scaffold9571_cov153-Cylindrotheca_fusiformis.AAC.1
MFRVGWQVQPSGEVVEIIGRVVKIHLGNASVTLLLGRVRKVGTVAKRVECTEEDSGEGADGCHAAFGSLTWSVDGGRVVESVCAGGFAESSFDAVANVVEGMFPHRDWSDRSPEGFKAMEGEAHDDSIKAGGCIRFKNSEAGFRE